MAIKQKLGDLLVKDGLITESDLRTMLAQQRQHGGRLGEHLVRVNLCSEEQIAQALARQLNLPFNDLSDPPAPAMSKLLPRDKAIKFQALVMGNNPFAPRLQVAFADVTDLKATMRSRRSSGGPSRCRRPRRSSSGGPSSRRTSASNCATRGPASFR